MGAHDQGADAINGRWVVIPRTLSFITHGDDVLLMMRGLHKRVFPGKYNGLGGHIERDEDPLASARREVEEESGLSVPDLRLRGLINIDAGAASSGILLLVFTGQATHQDVGLCDEGTLEWVPLATWRDKTAQMVEDLPLLLPRLFGHGATQELFFAHASYDTQDRLVMRFMTD